MSLADPTRLTVPHGHQTERISASRTGLRRLGFAALMTAALVAGFLATDGETARAAATHAGEDLTRLLRAMAMIKGAMALAAIGAILWRLGSAIEPVGALAYGVAGAAMMLSPGLIWNLSLVGWASVFMHAGLIGAIVLLWRDTAVSQRLDAMLSARRRG